MGQFRRSIVLIVLLPFDRNGKTISFYEDVSEILQTLRSRSRSPSEGSNSTDIEEQNVIVAACSRTHASDLYVFFKKKKLMCVHCIFIREFKSAHECLRLLLVPLSADESTPMPAIEFFDELEIYPGAYLAPSRR